MLIKDIQGISSYIKMLRLLRLSQLMVLTLKWKYHYYYIIYYYILSLLMPCLKKSIQQLWPLSTMEPTYDQLQLYFVTNLFQIWLNFIYKMSVLYKRMVKQALIKTIKSTFFLSSGSIRSKPKLMKENGQCHATLVYLTSCLKV